MSLFVHFQENVVGRIDELEFGKHGNNLDQVEVNLFDIDRNLVHSNRTNYPEKLISIPRTSSFVSIIEFKVETTIDDRPIRNFALAIHGCFFSVPKFTKRVTKTTRTNKKIRIRTTENKSQATFHLGCSRLELMNNTNIVRGLRSSSKLIDGDLSNIRNNFVTFCDEESSIEIVFYRTFLFRLVEISIDSMMTNVRRFRIELLNTENEIFHRIETNSLSLNFEHLPSVVLSSIRLTFLQPTVDGLPARNIRLSIISCVQEIFLLPDPTTTTTTTMSTTTSSSGSSTRTVRFNSKNIFCFCLIFQTFVKRSK